MAKPYQTTVEAFRTQEEVSWVASYALVKDIEVGPGGRVRSGEYARCQEALAEAGYDVSTSYLADLRNTGVAFPDTRARRWKLPFRSYLEVARTKSTAAQREKWLTQAEKQGMTLRQLSQLVTGKAWADSPASRVRAALRDDPDMLADAISEDPLQAERVVARVARSHPDVVARHGVTIREEQNRELFRQIQEERAAGGDSLRDARDLLGGRRPMLEASAALHSIRTGTRLLGHLRDDLATDERNELVADIEDSYRFLGMVLDLYRNQSSLDDDLAAFLAAEGDDK